jgi:hypothetical protein
MLTISVENTSANETAKLVMTNNFFIGRSVFFFFF